MEQRYRRAWFPDEQVSPDRVLEALRSRRQVAVADPAAVPWMSAADIAITLGVVTDRRFVAPGFELEDLLTPNAKVCHRKLPNGLRVHPVAARDIRNALNLYEATGQIVRLPHPLATWGVEFCPLDDADRLAMVETWRQMRDAREEARHAIQKHRLLMANRLTGQTT